MGTTQMLFRGGEIKRHETKHNVELRSEKNDVDLHLPHNHNILNPKPVTVLSCHHETSWR